MLKYTIVGGIVITLLALGILEWNTFLWLVAIFVALWVGQEMLDEHIKREVRRERERQGRRF